MRYFAAGDGHVAPRVVGLGNCGITELALQRAPHPACGHPPHEPESRTEPPHPGPLLHKYVEERGMERCAQVHGINARICSGKSLLATRGEGFVEKLPSKL